MIRTVLLVDDDPDIRMVGELALSGVGGLDTRVAASGPDAIAAVIADPPDVILLDVMMPEVDGPETFARLRADARSAAIPVVFCTAKTQRHEVERLRNLGAAGVISKPFDPMSLAEQVRNIVAGAQP